MARQSSQGEVISESPDHVGTMRSDSLHSLASHGHGGLESTTPWEVEHQHRTPNIERRTLNIEWKRIEEREVRSSQGEVISESPAHVGIMRSDSHRTLASHGHGGSESTTPWGMRSAVNFRAVSREKICRA
jgi:hypothetical protein